MMIERSQSSAKFHSTSKLSLLSLIETATLPKIENLDPSTKQPSFESGLTPVNVLRMLMIQDFLTSNGLEERDRQSEQWRERTH
jgi:hypothetical protein